MVRGDDTCILQMCTLKNMVSILWPASQERYSILHQKSESETVEGINRSCQEYTMCSVNLLRRELMIGMQSTQERCSSVIVCSI